MSWSRCVGGPVSKKTPQDSVQEFDITKVEFPALPGSQVSQKTPQDSVPEFDITKVEFPALPGSQTVSQKTPQDSVPEFNITKEEFPALPGSQDPPAQSSGPPATPPKSIPTQYKLMENTDAAEFIGPELSGAQTERGIQTHPDGTITNIPAGVVADQFGMVGLVSFLRNHDESDSSVASLLPGIDLTEVGLDLNSPENLYSTFESPWANSPCRPQDIDFCVPTEYLHIMHTRMKLPPINPIWLGEDVLFYLFYMYDRDTFHVPVALELYDRGWVYHKERGMWMTPVPNNVPVQMTGKSERGTYHFFDVKTWRKVTEEFHLEYGHLVDPKAK